MNDYKSKKVKRTIFVVLSVIILFISMLYSLCYVASDYGKGTAVLYFFIWIWAFNNAITDEETREELRRTKTENEIIKENLIVCENIIKKLEEELANQHERKEDD